MTLSASLSQAEWAVEPGGSMTCEVLLRNDAAVDDHVRITLLGAAAPWSWVVPPEVALAAGSEVRTHVGFRLPRVGEPHAGPVPFTVEVASTLHPEQVVSIDGLLRVAPFHHVSIALEPGGLARRVTVANLGNVAVRTTLRAAWADDDEPLAVEPAALTIEPGDRASATLSLPAPGRSRSRAPAVVVSAMPEGGETVTVRGSVGQPSATGSSRPRRAGAVGAVIAVALVATLLRLTLLAPQDRPASRLSVSAPSSTALAANPRCIAEGHLDRKVTGLTPGDIPLLPPDYSFLTLRQDGCTPIRWNPCEAIHFVVNPARAPPTGLADVRDGFARMAEATGVTFVDDGLTDEIGRQRDLYQPQRYGERWAPILVYWTGSGAPTPDIEVLGGGFPSRVGDVYVSGTLFLNSSAVNNTTTRSPLPGGYGEGDTGVGPVGTAGVTWGRVILHELGHLMGLSHVRDSSQLMYPETTHQTIRPVKFGAGDAAGLRKLSRGAGCLTTPLPAPSPRRGPRPAPR